MVWIDSISELEYFNPNPQWGCYDEPVYVPNDILLQARYGLPIGGGASYEISILKPDGTILEVLTTGDSHFDLFSGTYNIAGVTYNYTNIRCNNFTDGMIDNICFAIQFKLFDGSGNVLFSKLTQKYKLRDTTVGASGVTVSGDINEITLCGGSAIPNPCNIPNVKFVSIFDCIDTFTGDFYGDGTIVGTSYGVTPFPFVKLSNIQGRFRVVPKSVKSTISINNRTQRTETTDKYLLVGNVVFPAWKMVEIENMMLGSNLYIDGTEYKSQGGTFFKQIGIPYNCLYSYALSIDFIGRYQWQNFGCTPVCDNQSWYYLIP